LNENYGPLTNRCVMPKFSKLRKTARVTRQFFTEKKQQKRLELVLLSLILTLFLFRCSSGFDSQFHPKKLIEEYSNFLAGKVPPLEGMFSDDKLYSALGWLYIHGAIPDMSAHPPLAMYIIGLSELLFMNPVILDVIFSALTLVLVFLTSKKVVDTFPFALFPVLILSLDKLYIEFSSFAFLDVYATFFAVLAVFLLLSDKRWATPALYVTIGLALACKWTTAFLLFLPPIYYAMKKDWNHLKLYPLYILIVILAYAGTFSVYFLSNKTIMDFIHLHFTMFGIFQAQRTQMGSPPPLWILLNFLLGIEGTAHIQVLRAYPQNMTIVSGPVETGISLIGAYNPLTWPISFSASILTLVYSVKENRRILPVPLAFLVLVGLFSRGKPFIWYLIPGLPFAFISLAYMIVRIFARSENRSLAKGVLALYIASIFVWSLFINLPPYIKL
jgi:dolichyl-phosphate-mannose--protein O-mannosyl transferase